MQTIALVAVVVGIIQLATAKFYLKETFPDDAAFKKWKQSTHKSDYGEFKLTAGKFYGDAEADKGIQTSQDAKFYEFSRKLDTKFSNKDKTLVLQFSVKHEQNIDCGGGYIKLLPDSADLGDFHGETPYFVMFGPDICGPGTKKVHAILNYKGKNHQLKKDVRCKDDEFTHVYTLIIKPDQTYEILIDNEKVQDGELEADWDFLPAKKVKDPNSKKPSEEEHDEREFIDDPEDKKPADYDQPEHVADPDAKKPEDWDDEMDGEWEPPMIDNPAYKGEWKPKTKKNPKYKGLWVHPEIDNPEYTADKEIYSYQEIGAVGFDLWQVKAGTIFDNIIVSDDPAEAKKFAEETWLNNKEAEKKMKETQDEKERKKMEEEEKKREDEEKSKKKDDEEEDEDEDKKEPIEHEEL